MDQSKLKVPKCDIFDLLDFRDLITTKPVQVGNLGIEIKFLFFPYLGAIGAT